jgi:glutathione S-transferase
MTVITLYTFGPRFGMPDPSPFVMKAETLLKIAGLPYRIDTKGFSKAPKGKLPYIEDDGERIADSTFIRWHLEKKYRIDFDRGLGEEARAVAWAFERYDVGTCRALQPAITRSPPILYYVPLSRIADPASTQATRRRLGVRLVAAGRAESVRPKERTMRMTVLNSGLPVSPSAL